jgi:hypothetical protein
MISMLNLKMLFCRGVAFAVSVSGSYTVRSYFESPVKENDAGMTFAY